MRFPIYEHLYQLNRNLHETVEILERIRKSPGMNKKRFHAYQVEIEHLRAEASQDIAKVVDQIESKESFEFWKQKRAYEKSISDPDDVYFEVSHREEERRKKGLPPLIGILRGRFTREEAIAMVKHDEPKATPSATMQRPSLKSKSTSSRRMTTH
jgi:regulator of replication initiation timing